MRTRLDSLFGAIGHNDAPALQRFFDSISYDPALMYVYLEKLEQVRKAAQRTSSAQEEKEHWTPVAGPFPGIKSDSRTALGSGVLAGAFHPNTAVMTAAEEKACSDVMCSLYGGTVPVYTWDAGRGETTRRRHFKAQMEILTDRLFGSSVVSAMPNFYQYENQYRNHPDTKGSAAEINRRIDSYYSTIKKNLEKIYFLREKNTLNLEQSFIAAVVEEMETDVGKCGAGILGHTVRALNSLMLGSSPGLRKWLAELRLGILEKWVSKIMSEGEHESFDVHIEAAALEVSAEKKLHIPGDTVVAAVKENSAAKRKEKAAEFEHYFKQHYTRAEMIDCVASRLATEIKSIFPGHDRYFSWSNDMADVLGCIFSKGSQYGGGWFLDMERVRVISGNKHYFLRKMDFHAMAEDMLVSQKAIISCCDFSLNEATCISNALEILTAEQQRLGDEPGSGEKHHIVEDVIDRVNTIRGDRVGRKRERISDVIRDELIDGAGRLKEKNWAEWLGLAVLNVLMVVPGLGIPAYIKYLKTGSAFFSLAPKEVSDDIVCSRAMQAVRCLKVGVV